MKNCDRTSFAQGSMGLCPFSHGLRRGLLSFAPCRGLAWLVRNAAQQRTEIQIVRG